MKYTISTAWDLRVCGICKDAGNEVYLISERQPGDSFPPFHP